MLLCLLAAPAAADPAADEAAHVQAANDYFANGDFEGALAEYRAAYAIDPRSDYLYAMATIEDQRGGCAAAIDLYQQFLDTHPPDQDAVAAQQAIDACKVKLGIVEPHEEEPPPPPPPVVDERPVIHRVHHRYSSDILGDALVGLGVAGLGTGAVLYGMARSSLSDAEAPHSQDDYDALVARAHDRRSYSAGAFVAGGLLVVSGMLRWMVADRWVVVPEPEPGGASLSVSSRW